MSQPNANILPDLQAQLNALRAENEALKANARTVTIKMGEKGGISVYGLGRFPVTLYPSQWLALFGQQQAIAALATANAAELKRRGEATKAAKAAAKAA